MILNSFENFPLDNASASLAISATGSQGWLGLHVVSIPGTLTANSVAFLFNGLQTTATASSTRNMTFWIGLYSLTGSTLTLLNNATMTTQVNSANSLQWYTIALSTSTVITPGNYFLGFMTSRSGGGGPTGYGMVGNSKSNLSTMISTITSASSLWYHNYIGPFFRGHFSTSTNALPASINTSACNKGGSVAAAESYPYILIC